MIKTPSPLYRGHRFPAEVVAHAVWLYFRFPLSLRMVEYLPGRKTSREIADAPAKPHRCDTK